MFKRKLDRVHLRAVSGGFKAVICDRGASTSTKTHLEHVCTILSACKLDRQQPSSSSLSEHNKVNPGFHVGFLCPSSNLFLLICFIFLLAPRSRLFFFTFSFFHFDSMLCTTYFFLLTINGRNLFCKICFRASFVALINVCISVSGRVGPAWMHPQCR